jgi:hypothetical protein
LPFEKAILHTLNKTYLSKSFRELQQNFTQLQETLKLSASDPVQQIVFSMFNIPAWIESKLHRVPYKEWVQKELSNTLALNKSAS